MVPKHNIIKRLHCSITYAPQESTNDIQYVLEIASMIANRGTISHTNSILDFPNLYCSNQQLLLQRHIRRDYYSHIRLEQS